MFSAALLAALLTLTDPTGDAVGNGTLTAPTATAFRSTAVFDVRSVSVPDAATFGFTLEFGLLPPPGAFPQAITELYVHDAGAAARGRPGRTALLPGSGMRLPEGRGWHLAFRLTGAELQVFSDNPAAGNPVTSRPPDEVTQALGARVTRRGNMLTVTTELSTPERFSLYGMTGMYDPFDETGWRALRSEPSPWGFSSLDQRVPVLDVMTDSYAQQQQAIDRGTLPEIRAAFAQEGWLLLAGVGVFIALAGLAARFAVRRDATTAAPGASSSSPPPHGDAPALVPPVPAHRVAALRALSAGRATLSLRTPSAGGETLPPAEEALQQPLQPAPPPSEARNRIVNRVVVVKRPTPPAEVEAETEPEGMLEPIGK